MEQLIKTIAEVKSALDQATLLVDENTQLKEELKTLKAQQVSPAAYEVAKKAFKAGERAILEQLEGQEFSTTKDIEESIYEGGFEVSFCNEVDIEISLDEVVSEVIEMATDSMIADCCQEWVTELATNNTGSYVEV